MKVIKTDNYAEMSKYAATYIINRLKLNKSLVLGLATGGTPLGTYQNLIKDHKSNNTSYSQVKTVNLDEYIGLGKEDKNSYHYFMKQYLFKDIDIIASNTFIPNGLATNLEEECERYEKLINKMGGIDLQILGIGLNGHIGFNEPWTPFSSRTHVVELTPSTREANTRFFSDQVVPTRAITMGIKTIMEAKEILLLASGSKKAEAVYKLLTGSPNEQFPASELSNHPNVTIIADQDALSLYISKTPLVHSLP